MKKKNNKPKKKFGRFSIFFWSIVLILILLAAWYFVPVTEYIDLDLSEEEGKEAKIALITDLHSCYYGKNMKGLLNRIEKENPDFVLLAGDIFDDNKNNKNSKIFCEALAEKYPVYYATGNHEYWSGEFDEIKSYMEGIGVYVLDGNAKEITVNELTFDIAGVDDPSSLTSSAWRKQLNAAYDATDPSHIRILISHRPDRVDVYENYDYDLIVAGHAHGGQFYLPFVNKGFFSPNQGLFPEYVNGLYELNNGSKMVVSRGLARESTPAPRYFNHPEVVILNVH